MTLFPSLHPLHSPSLSVFKDGKKNFDWEAFPGLLRSAECWVLRSPFSAGLGGRWVQSDYLLLTGEVLTEEAPRPAKVDTAAAQDVVMG